MCRVIAAHFALPAVNVRQLNCVLISLKRARFKYYHFDLKTACLVIEDYSTNTSDLEKQRSTLLRKSGMNQI